MRPLNYKDRTRFILKFVFAFLPAVIFSLLALSSFAKSAWEHSRFIKVKYEYEQTKYSEQALLGEKVDSILTLADKLLTSDLTEDRYKYTTKKISRIRDNGLDYTITEDSKSPYHQILKEIKMIQASMDSLYNINKEHKKNKTQLLNCKEIYEEQWDEMKRKRKQDKKRARNENNKKNT